MIDDWVEDSNQPSIFWLSGMAGTGKSTIAKTVAEKLDKKGELGASFFFSKDVGDLCSDRYVLTTLAYQLARYDNDYRVEVTRILQDDPDVADLNLTEQFQSLIIEPFQSNAICRERIVIVIDALDECAGEPQSIVTLFSSSSIRALPISLKLLVTGRPEIRLTRALSQSSIKDGLQPLYLHEIEDSIVRGDIALYLDHHFRRLVDNHPKLQMKGWPEPEEIEKLADKVGDLFIFASTAMKFISEARNPEKRLRLILSDETFTGGIDSLYTQVLEFMFPQDYNGEFVTIFRDVIGSIVCLGEPLPVGAIRHLLGVPSSSLWEVLECLSSIAIVPKTSSDYLQLIHPSFSDFLTQEGRCTDHRFLVDKKQQHTLLACVSLKCMLDTLKRNICNIEDPLVFNSDIPGLEDILSSKVPLHVRYACSHWAYHVSKADPSSTALLTLLRSFCTTKFLPWLEILSLSDQVDAALSSVTLVQSWLLVSHSCYQPASKINRHF